MQLLHVTRKVAHVIPDLEVLASSHEVKSSAVMDRQRTLASNRLRQHQRQVRGRLQMVGGAAGYWLRGATSRTSWVPTGAVSLKAGHVWLLDASSGTSSRWAGACKCRILKSDSSYLEQQR